LERDVWYVDHWSLLLDLKLICLTVLRLHQLTAVGASPGLENTDDLGLTEMLHKHRKHPAPVSLS
jgi:hypothetical protein